MTAVSDPNGTLVDTSPLHNRHWMTVCANEVALAWDWPDDAVRAQLQIASMNSGVLTCELTPPAASYVWRVFADAGVLRHDMYEISLKFFDADDEPAGALTARLAVVPGALGSAPVMTRPAEVPWPSLKANRVIPYDAGWAEATAAAGLSRLAIAKQGGREQVNMLAEASG